MSETMRNTPNQWGAKERPVSVPIKAEPDEVEKLHKELCLELNMDSDASSSSWCSYTRVSNEYLLEGDAAHWLSCPLYIACRSSQTPTVGGTDALVEGNCVSLTHLLRSCKITFLEFFNKMQQWMDMTTSSQKFRERIDRLKNNLCVSLLVYEKYQAIFKDVFVGLHLDEQRIRKKTAATTPCTAHKLYEFCWYMFLCAKSEYPENSVDLVTTFHMLLCCVDLVFANVMHEKRKDLINPKLFANPDWNAVDLLQPSSNNQAICIINLLCKQYDGTVIDAIVTKTYTYKTIINKYLREHVLRCDDKFMGLLSVEHFEQNLNALKNVYKSYFLSVGEIDEGILLTQIENSAMKQNLKKETDESKKQLTPATPLTRRHCLPGKDAHLEPVAMATRSVERLRDALGQYDPQPPTSLKDFLASCTPDPLPKIKAILSNMSTLFCAKFETNATDRFELAETLYYRLLENILRKEMADKNMFDKIVNHEMFHTTLITCSVEIVIYAYMSQKKFPWVLDCFNLEAFNFYKVIEMIVLNHRDILSRDIIKHLNSIEEKCLDSLVWRSSSPLWEQIDKCAQLPERQHADQPKMTPNHIDHSMHHRNRNGAIDRLLLQSPVTNVTERFQPETPGDHVSKQLFKTGKLNLHPQSNDDRTQTLVPAVPVVVVVNSPMKLFFRKFYKLAYLRMREICLHLNYLNDLFLQKIWTIFEYSITKRCPLMRDRHLDQILMCAIYVFGRNNKFQTTFKDIMLSYRKQPQTTSDVYRDVHMSEADIEFEREATQQPKTPNRKYDIISFYNNCYVRSMQEFVITTKEEGMLSPLPSYGTHMKSPRKISEHHSLYIQPFEPKDLPSSPNTMTYSFKASPVENIGQIQRVFAKALTNSNGKRELPFVRGHTEDEGEMLLVKPKKHNLFKVSRLTVSGTSADEKSVPYIREKLQKIITDRQGQ